MRLVVALVVWIGAVAAAVGVSSVVAQHAGSATASGSSSFDASAVQAADKNSLFHAANLAKALAIARHHLGGRAEMDSLTIYPGYLSFNEVTGSRETDIYIDASGRYDASDGGSHIGNDPLIRLSRAQPAALSQLAHRIARASDTPLSQLHYAIFEPDSISHKPHWLIYTVQGNPTTYFEASGPRGRLFKLGSQGLEPVRG